jgi:16S rRNA (adenine1518-N6/adenine1519-N6)-dimethyltransferase
MSAPGAPLDRLPRTRREWSSLLTGLGVRPSKGKGQNFLVEPGVVAKIVKTAGITPGDRVIEVGPGLGMLTGHLLDAGAFVTAIELDRDLVPHLRKTFGDLEHFAVVEGDALRVPLDQLLPTDTQYSVVANLPYSIASAVIMRFLELPDPPESMTVMVQREVAERLMATPPAMTVLSVATQVLSVPIAMFLVAPGSFLPPPRVESAVVTLLPLGDERITTDERPLFFKLVNGGFRHKRKQVLNSLALELDLSKDEIAARLIAGDIDPMRRAQTISVSEWIELTRLWERAE